MALLCPEKLAPTSVISVRLDVGNPSAPSRVGKHFFLDIPFYRTEWHRVVAWHGLGERVAASLRQGDHVLVEGTLVSSSYEREYGKGKKARTVKHTVWQIRADSIRKLNRGENEPEALTLGSNATAAEQPPPSATRQTLPFREHLSRRKASNLKSHLVTPMDPAMCSQFATA
ncbi:MAG TPA: single-stranded DNA-binding protein [Candidatus Acidoferrales bacterium]|nr:single-stranded DNA-binding protein [Candidatus Acidoferrales bacterium]